MDFLRDEYDAWFGTDRPKTRVLPRVIQKLQMAPQKLVRHDEWLHRVLDMPRYAVARRH